MNLVLGMMMLGASSIAVWGGITDPEGGVLAGLRNLFTGQGNSKRAGNVGFLADLAAVNQSLGHTPGSGLGQPGPTAAPVGPPKPRGSSGSTPAPTTGVPSAIGGSARRQAIVNDAAGWVGVPYKWGGNTRKGVDCSGLVQQVFKGRGVSLPRVSYQQAGQGKRVTAANSKPGDLVAFGAPVHHIGIVVGNGYMIHAPKPGGKVRIESIDGCAKAMRAPVQYRNVLG